MSITCITRGTACRIGNLATGASSYDERNGFAEFGGSVHHRLRRQEPTRLCGPRRRSSHTDIHGLAGQRGNTGPRLHARPGFQMPQGRRRSPRGCHGARGPGRAEPEGSPQPVCLRARVRASHEGRLTPRVRGMSQVLPHQTHTEQRDEHIIA